MIPLLRFENPNNHTQSGGTNLSRRDAKTSCLVIQTEGFILPGAEHVLLLPLLIGQLACLHLQCDWPDELRQFLFARYYLRNGLHAGKRKYEWSTTFQRSVQYSLNGIPRSLYTHVIYACPYWSKIIVNYDNGELLLFSPASYGI